MRLQSYKGAIFVFLVFNFFQLKGQTSLGFPDTIYISTGTYSTIHLPYDIIGSNLRQGNYIWEINKAVAELGGQVVNFTPEFIYLEIKDPNKKNAPITKHHFIIAYKAIPPRLYYDFRNMEKL